MATPFHDSGGVQGISARRLPQGVYRRLMEAWRIALLGYGKEAEALLSQGPAASPTPEELDLRARIAISRGRTDYATELWKEILRQRPDDLAATAAIDRLRSKWRIRIWIRSLLIVLFIGVVLSLAIIGASTLVYLSLYERNWITGQMFTVEPLE